MLTMRDMQRRALDHILMEGKCLPQSSLRHLRLEDLQDLFSRRLQRPDNDHQGNSHSHRTEYLAGFTALDLFAFVQAAACVLVVFATFIFLDDQIAHDNREWLVLLGKICCFVGVSQLVRKEGSGYLEGDSLVLMEKKKQC